MSDKELKIYRCLRSARQVNGGKMHDECADIIARNPELDFRPGLTGVYVEHEVHQQTYWDANFEHYPLGYMESCEGRLGYIIVSVRLDLLRAADLPWGKDPRFYQPEYFRDDEKRCSWYIAGSTALVRVCVEKVIEPVPLNNV